MSNKRMGHNMLKNSNQLKFSILNHLFILQKALPLETFVMHVRRMNLSKKRKTGDKREPKESPIDGIVTDAALSTAELRNRLVL
jgi:hypothetical protein